MAPVDLPDLQALKERVLSAPLDLQAQQERQAHRELRESPDHLDLKAHLLLAHLDQRAPVDPQDRQDLQALKELQDLRAYLERPDQADLLELELRGLREQRALPGHRGLLELPGQRAPQDLRELRVSRG